VLLLAACVDEPAVAPPEARPASLATPVAPCDAVRTWYLDRDGDGHGDATEPLEACGERPDWAAARAGDCDDDDASVHPDAVERCDAAGVDEDCDGRVDEDDPSVAPQVWFADADGDGFHGTVASYTGCATPDDLTLIADDCDDQDASVRPFRPEVCNGIDDDCNGEVDDACGPADARRIDLR
jgi:hypothetical protein